MIDVHAEKISFFSRCRKPQILICWWDSGQSIIIKENVLKLEKENKSEMGLRILRVCWDDLIKQYNPPPHISPSTIFYMREGFTVGTIENPDYETLKNFYLYCNTIIINFKNLSNLKIDAEMPHLKYARDKYNMKILSPDCSVYQFKMQNKRQTYSNLPTEKAINFFDECKDFNLTEKAYNSFLYPKHLEKLSNDHSYSDSFTNNFENSFLTQKMLGINEPTINNHPIAKIAHKIDPEAYICLIDYLAWKQRESGEIENLNNKNNILNNINNLNENPKFIKKDSKYINLVSSCLINHNITSKRNSDLSPIFSNCILPENSKFTLEYPNKSNQIKKSYPLLNSLIDKKDSNPNIRFVNLHNNFKQNKNLGYINERDEISLSLKSNQIVKSISDNILTDNCLDSEIMKIHTPKNNNSNAIKPLKKSEVSLNSSTLPSFESCFSKYSFKITSNYQLSQNNTKNKNLAGKFENINVLKMIQKSKKTSKNVNLKKLPTISSIYKFSHKILNRSDLKNNKNPHSKLI